MSASQYKRVVGNMFYWKQERWNIKTKTIKGCWASKRTAWLIRVRRGLVVSALRQPLVRSPPGASPHRGPGKPGAGNRKCSYFLSSSAAEITSASLRMKNVRIAMKYCTAIRKQTKRSAGKGTKNLKVRAENKVAGNKEFGNNKTST